MRRVAIRGRCVDSIVEITDFADDRPADAIALIKRHLAQAATAFGHRSRACFAAMLIGLACFHAA